MVLMIQDTYITTAFLHHAGSLRQHRMDTKRCMAWNEATYVSLLLLFGLVFSFPLLAYKIERLASGTESSVFVSRDGHEYLEGVWRLPVTPDTPDRTRYVCNSVFII
jgi:hypothetical protein